MKGDKEMKQMIITNNDATIAVYAMNRAENPVFGALQMAKCSELVNKLRSGIVHGYFTKTDGSIREFFGTTSNTLAEKYTQCPIGTMPKLPLGQIPFWDIEKAAWRSMRIGSFIGFAE